MKEKFCIKSTDPFQTINQSPTNHSGSKQTFSFSKSSRFESIKSVCPNNTYGGSDIGRKDSGASIGYGKKSDFTKGLDNPEAGKYSISSVFDLNKNKKKGVTIGTSRQKIKFNAYVEEGRLQNPGIGRYKVDQEVMIRTSRAPAFSLGHRTKPTDLRNTIQAQNKNPSPAEYENNPEMSKTLYASHFKKTGFIMPNSKRFPDPNNNIPGPSDYESGTGLSSIGKYVMSSHKGGTKAKFDGSKRKTKFDECAVQAKTKPGPGAYRASSEFGQYDGDVYASRK